MYIFEFENNIIPSDFGNRLCMMAYPFISSQYKLIFDIKKNVLTKSSFLEPTVDITPNIIEVDDIIYTEQITEKKDAYANTYLNTLLYLFSKSNLESFYCDMYYMKKINGEIIVSYNDAHDNTQQP